MAAAAEVMPMALSPGLDAIRNSPLSASAESLQLTDYLDFGAHAAPAPVNNSPAPSSLPLPRPAATASTSAGAGSLGAASKAATANTATSAAAAAASSSSTSSTPPPPGSAPEVVFRYYLKLELRKMGSPADDATIDRYVQQHYDTFLRAMDNGKQSGSASTSSASAPPQPPARSRAPALVKATPQVGQQASAERAAAEVAPLTAPHQSQPTPGPSSRPAALSPPSAHIKVEGDTSIGVGGDEHDDGAHLEPLQSVSPGAQIQPFKIPPVDETVDDFSLPSLDHCSPGIDFCQSVDPQYVQFRGQDIVPVSLSLDGDAMSEDGQPDTSAAFLDVQEDSKDELAPLVSSLRFASASQSERDRSVSSEPSQPKGPSARSLGGVPPSIRDSAAVNLRPTAEEYRALSSKEKRQLRNKISARNFRERRKEYITHLEGEISDRDALIDSLRLELSKVSLQNKKLEDEVKTLQARSLSQTDVQKILEALQNVTVPPLNFGAVDAGTTVNGLRASAPYDVTLSSSAGFINSRPSTPSSPRPSLVRRGTPTSALLAQHNPRKDISVSAAAAGLSSSSSQQQPWNRSGSTVAASA
ncbi:unnamed protein product [Parajaminaea phylloscopi]